MHKPRYLLATLLCFALGPAVAQDGGGDDGSGIEVSPDPKPGEEKKGDGYDPEETKKKNAGLAGGGDQGEGDDPNAPKVKADLQTRINVAIERGVEALKALQDKKTGSWGPVRATQKYENPNEKGNFIRDELGPTAWSLYTLAKCGVKKDDQVMKDGLKYLEQYTATVFDVVGGTAEDKGLGQGGAGQKKKGPRSLTTYESAAIVLMIEAVYQESAKLTGKQSKRVLFTDNALKPPAKSKIPEDAWKSMHDRILWLTVGRKISSGRTTNTIKGTQNIGEGGKNQGGWRYSQANGDADLSATQFVLLGLRAASQAGYPVEKTAPQAWQQAAQYIKNCQKPDGGFGYQVGGPSYASMTACGVGGLLICKEQMELSSDREKDKEKKPPAWIDDSIAKGMEWLDKNFDAERNAGADQQELFYYLYGVERVGDLSGRKEFNGKDWYLRGATLLLDRQEADGKWNDSTGFPPGDVLGTCFALLFLKRATIPVVTVSEK